MADVGNGLIQLNQEEKNKDIFNLGINEEETSLLTTEEKLMNPALAEEHKKSETIESLNQEKEQQIGKSGSFDYLQELKPKSTNKMDNLQKNSQSREEKKAVEEDYRYSIQFHQDYAKPRREDSSAMRAIRAAMKDYFDTKEHIENKSKEATAPMSDEAKLLDNEELDVKLENIEQKCNSYLRFRLSFSKKAKEHTAQVKEVREKAKEMRMTNALREGDVSKETRSVGKSIKNFFTNRIPSGFKNVGRSIKKPFVNTFSHRSAGQVAKGFLRDHIWGGIFRNAFNLVAMGVVLPFWMANVAVKKSATILQKATNNSINADKIKVIPLPMPHLPSTWTRYHDEMYGHKESSTKENSDNSSKSEGEIEKRRKKEDPTKGTFFKLFGWHPKMDQKGSGPSYEGMTREEIKKAKDARIYPIKQDRDSIMERARLEQLSILEDIEDDLQEE